MSSLCVFCLLGLLSIFAYGKESSQLERYVLSVCHVMDAKDWVEFSVVLHFGTVLGDAIAGFQMVSVHACTPNSIKFTKVRSQRIMGNTVY